MQTPPRAAGRKPDTRGSRGSPAATLRDALRTTWRGAAKRPGFAALVVLTFAVGIGANTAIFTVADATLRRGLPYPEPDRLVAVFETRGVQDFDRMEASYPNFLDWRASMKSYDGIAGYNDRSITLDGERGVEMVNGGLAMGDFFRVLGARAALGRLIEPSDEAPAAARVAVLSYGAWQARFGGDPAVLGRTLSLGGEPATVVGVLPADFAFGLVDDPVVWMAARPEGPVRERRNLHWVNVIGRLRPGVDAAQAQAEAIEIQRRLARTHPDANRAAGALVAPLADQILGKARPIMVLLLCAAGLVLLIACANIANLLLARQTTRTKELAIRAALGASRFHLVALLTIEALLHALAGGALGLLLAVWSLDAILGTVPDTVLRGMPFLAGARLDAAAMAATFALALGTGIAVGVLSALRAARPDLADMLKRDGRSASSDPKKGRLRDALVVSEVALAFLILVGAGLVARSLVQVLAVDPGFDPHQLVTARVLLPAERYGDDARAAAAHDEILARLAALPGSRGAASVSRLPLGDGGNTIRYLPEGRPAPDDGLEPEANIRDVSPGYFETMGVLVVDGRAFEPSDRAGAEQVVIVNQTLAEREFPGGAVGKHLTFTFAKTEKPRRIVGVIGDERLGPLDAAPRPAVYSPYAQGPNAGISFVVRGPVNGNDIARAVRELDASIPVYEVQTMEQRMADAPWMFVRRFPAMLVGGFAAIALVLTAIGIYGVLSYTVRQRTHEIGIRRAIGAGRRQILRLVLGRAVALAGLGLAIGIGAALAGARLLSSLLFGVAPWDPVTFAIVAVGLLGTALVSSWLPARAALRVHPAEALRSE